MKFTLLIAVPLIVIYFNSCSNPPSFPPKHDSLSSPFSMAGKLYLFAPELDSTKLVATGACDCCSANILFLDDSSFLYIGYCEAGSSYVLGKYQADNLKLTPDFDSITVEKYYPEPGDSTGKLTPKPIFHIDIRKPDKQTYKRQEYKGMILFVDKEVGAPDKDNNFGELMKNIHNEGIWDRLRINPKTSR